MPKTFTRPGVEAAVRLSNIKNTNTWQAIEAKYHDMLHEKNGIELPSLDQACEKLGTSWRKWDGDGTPYCTCEELSTVIQWKFSKGKPRPLWKLIHSNSEESVKNASFQSFSVLSDVPVHEDDYDFQRNKGSELDSILKEAIEQFSVLKGIGPASATAFLSLYRPDLCIFMDDEVIECLYPGKRAYSVKIYLDINAKCRALAGGLGEGWNARRVGRALWTAARLSLCESTQDLTLEGDEPVPSVGKLELGDEIKGRNKGRNIEYKVSPKRKVDETSDAKEQKKKASVTSTRRSKRLKR
jgi:hypothetical protein